jgi:hypothetical protein
MNPQQAENLRILIRHMEGGNVKELYMPLSDHTCGTACCAMGEARRIGISGATILPGDIGAISPSARRAFGMNESNGHPQSWIRLFGGNLRGNYRPTPQEWAAEARKVLAEHGYSMGDEKPPMTFKSFMVKVLEPRPELQGLPNEAVQ